MATGLSQHEVVRISRRGYDNGYAVIQEISFLSDRSMQLRFTSIEDGEVGDSTGWIKIPATWPADVKELMAKILKMQRLGWAAVWGSGYGPEPSVADFMMMVEW